MNYLPGNKKQKSLEIERKHDQLLQFKKNRIKQMNQELRLLQLARTLLDAAYGPIRDPVLYNCRISVDG